MLHYASLTGVLKTLLLIALIYYGFKLIARIFAPLFLNYLSKKVSKKFEQQFGSTFNYKEPAASKEGEVTIQKMPKYKKSDKKIGEYVDYEEID